MFAGDKLL